jgi:hypothetical protein
MVTTDFEGANGGMFKRNYFDIFLYLFTSLIYALLNYVVNSSDYRSLKDMMINK